MLNSRQQQCLRGIGISQWRERGTGEADTRQESAIEEPLSAQDLADIGQFIGGSPNAEQAPQPIPVEAEASSAVDVVLPPLDNWDAVTGSITHCTACELAQHCTQKVPGVGDIQADLLIVGEGPGHDEDLRGEPFVGRSGQLLDRMLAAIGIAREQVYITNIVKCRPPNNRDPKVDEAQRCRNFLEAQIKLIKPRVILAVGRVSAHNLLDSNLPVGKLIRDMHRLPGSDIPVKVTYHPAYLLRNPSAKAIAWQDLKLLHGLLQ